MGVNTRSLFFFIRASALGACLFVTILIGGYAIASNDSSVSDAVIVLTAEELIEVAQKYKKLLLIDSRNPTDRVFGQIEGSVGLPNTETNCNSLSRITTSLDQPLVFYCNGVRCERSANAVSIASNCGYTHLYWFKGGIEEWRKKRYPLLNHGS